MVHKDVIISFLKAWKVTVVEIECDDAAFSRSPGR